MHRLYPNVFDRDVPNPWQGVTENRRAKATKPAVTREQVYVFANAAIDVGYPEAGAAAVICFEWLQRPENVLAGFIRWTDYRGRDASTAIRITHHKTGAVILHPLEETIIGENGYAKRTMERALAATRKRHAHRLANAAGTDVQNEPQIRVQNETGDACREAK